MINNQVFQKLKNFCVILLKEIDSTNDEAVRIITNGNFDGRLSIIAENQTRGRGKQNAIWLSAKDNIAMTLAFGIEQLTKDFENFSIIIAEVIRDTILKYKMASLDFECTVKFPNDLLINGKKAAGVLPEMHFLNNRKYLVIGIGINWMNAPLTTFERISDLVQLSREDFIEIITLKIEEKVQQIFKIVI